MEHVWTGVTDLLVSLLTAVFIYVARQIGQVNNSIQTLNMNIAVIINRLESHDHRLDRTEDRIDKIEEKI